jgi:hypothetical protein
MRYVKLSYRWPVGLLAEVLVSKDQNPFPASGRDPVAGVTIIGQTMRIQGTITSREEVHLNGHWEGQMEVDAYPNFPNAARAQFVEETFKENELVLGPAIAFVFGGQGYNALALEVRKEGSASTTLPRSQASGHPQRSDTLLGCYRPIGRKTVGACWREGLL